ncbi:hypothetical protein [Streptomyces sp. NBC_01207]|uniref:hypothetical protein n=1 Tax=Streptomyces sp. NBC_01207 TaxID=2903772 RepID=UPI002E13F89A|nr:hypothetical protein OG457_49640 [Streptomyces sp. NBC_01207]
MPGSDQTPSDKDGAEPQPGGESRTNRQLLVGVAQAFLAGLADDAAHWFIRFAVWLYEIFVSHM